MSDSESGTKLVVPKFSSFKARDPARPTKADGGKGKQRERSHSRDRHRDKRHRSHHSQDSRRREERSSRHRERQAAPPQEPAQGPKALLEKTTSSAFVIDTKGDHLILKYGLDRAKVPAYYRYGGGRVLGTAGRLVIHREGPRDQFSLRFPGDGVGFFDKDGLRSKSFRLTRDPIRLRARASESDEDDTFLAVGSSKKRKQDERDSESEDDEGLSYRSIEGKAKAKAALESDHDSSGSEDEVVDLEHDNPLRWKSIQLNRQVKDHPGDIDAWMELVDHQDDLQRAGETIDERTTANTAHSFSEIKVDMLESALSNAIVAEDREIVLVRLMREGMKIWPSKLAAKKWSEIEKEVENNFELWRAHLDFAMSNISSFQYDDVKQMLLDRLRAVLSRAGAQEKHWEEAIYVFLRTTRLMHDSGYKELAVAAWQALLEFNFFRGGSEMPGTGMEAFRDFWESEVPRLGEEDAKGWKYHMSTGGQVEAPEPRKDNPVADIATRDAYKAWAHYELGRAQSAKLPARTMDDGTEDDPFRVVMISDIEPLLFMVPDALLQGRPGELLLDAFLIFCGLPPLFRSTPLAELAFDDQFTSSSTVTSTAVRQATLLDDPEEVRRKPPSFSRVLNAALSPGLLFTGADWFQYFGSSLTNLPVEMAFVKNVLKHLVHEAEAESLALYYLGFSFASERPLVKKPAKALLKKYPNNADLYNAYALAEFANDNVDVGKKVLVSAMEAPSLSVGAPGFQLHKSLSWEELKAGNRTQAITWLCSAFDKSLRQAQADHGSISPAVILKTRQEIVAHIHQCLYEGRANDAAVFIEGLTLLSYLTDGGNIEPTSGAQGNISAAMNAIEGMSAEFKSRGDANTRSHERMLQFGAQLLYLNATRGPFRRIYLREQLSKFLDFFPRNSIFLSLAEWADSSLRVIDETRQLLYDKILIKQHDCLSSRVFSIEHEISRGNANTAKAAFEHALSSDVCKTNTGLWIAYLRFSYAHRELRPKVKDLFYRGLRHCPWSKDIMMEAFCTLIRDMKSDELRSVYNTMTGKGLRLHLDMDEFVERWRRDRQGRDGK
ncbi:hypothetical protein H634G_06222 [Metarhizium anisopliae BRIP 53293]|uniref:DUF1740-domain-containing protein n=1 Tax=Metarhizium anisopliae BRIP 53293 TaxID=1291518 RepID=A0A0D9NWZ2_METAN|nr:hypothetical protein H634G_06222 [Metarhizium anisopliae BRIP 53293]KJK85918.1 hypothetical protein H633G_10237 [Metarhizium anisopliae BRIP 53284]